MNGSEDIRRPIARVTLSHDALDAIVEKQQVRSQGR
jgi:hypothetical protein